MNHIITLWNNSTELLLEEHYTTKTALKLQKREYILCNAYIGDNC